jgi:hypothetical protein
MFQLANFQCLLCVMVGDGSSVPGLVTAADEELMADAIKSVKQARSVDYFWNTYYDCY